MRTWAWPCLFLFCESRIGFARRLSVGPRPGRSGFQEEIPGHNSRPRPYKFSGDLFSHAGEVRYTARYARTNPSRLNGFRRLLSRPARRVKTWGAGGMGTPSGTSRSVGVEHPETCSTVLCRDLFFCDPPFSLRKRPSGPGSAVRPGSRLRSLEIRGGRPGRRSEFPERYHSA